MTAPNDKKLRSLKLRKAFVLFRKNKFEKAEQLFYQFIDEYPDDPRGYVRFAGLFKAQKKYEQASLYFRIATEMLPHSKLASLGLFLMLWEMEEYQPALDEIKRFQKAGGRSKDYKEIIEELKEKKMIDDDFNWLED